MDQALDSWPLTIVGGVIFLLLMAAWEAGAVLGQRTTADDSGDAAHGYILSGVLGLLALLIAFTFGMALDRFETRRGLAMTEANAIGTAEMRVHLLDPPAAAQLSGMLRTYAVTRLRYGLASAVEKPSFASASERQRGQIQTATLSAVQPIRTTPLAALVVSAVNDMIDTGASREEAHAARLPASVMVVLVVYAAVAAGVLGYALSASRARRRAVSALMFLLLSLALCLILDLDRARGGSIKVSQAPMERLVASLRPPATPGLPPSPAMPASSGAVAPSRP